MKALAMPMLMTTLLGCSAPVKPARPAPPLLPPTATELSPALQPFAWLLGAYGDETWVAASGAMYGITLRDDHTFDVMIVDDDADGDGPADGTLRLFAMPNGDPTVEFTEQTRASTDSMAQIVFANDTQSKSYVKHGATLDNKPQVALQPAPELERADRAFSDDTGKRGVAGWMAAFAPTAWMMRKGAKVTGEEIGTMMQPLLDKGTLAWAPLASGMRGSLGFTVGKATFTSKATNAIEWRSTYATIWTRGEDGAWKVLFDVGRGVNE